MDVERLIERALRKVQVAPATGGGTISADGGATCYITDDGYRLVNPDGPALAEALSRQKAAGDAMKEALQRLMNETPLGHVPARVVLIAAGDALTAWNSIEQGDGG